jgi:hypothetical protein
MATQGPFGYEQDRELVALRTGAELTPEQFASYSGQFRLFETFTEDSIRAHFSRSGLNSNLAAAFLMRDILVKLHEAGVTLDLGAPDSAFRRKLVQAMWVTVDRNYQWLRVPRPYMSTSDMQQTVADILERNPYLERDNPFKQTLQPAESPSAGSSQTDQSFDA